MSKRVHDLPRPQPGSTRQLADSLASSNALPGLYSLLYTQTARRDLLNAFYVLSKDVSRLNSSIRRQQHGMIYQHGHHSFEMIIIME